MPLGESRTVIGVGVGLEGEVVEEAEVPQPQLVEAHGDRDYWTRTGMRR